MTRMPNQLPLLAITQITNHQSQFTSHQSQQPHPPPPSPKAATTAQSLQPAHAFRLHSVRPPQVRRPVSHHMCLSKFRPGMHKNPQLHHTRHTTQVPSHAACNCARKFRAHNRGRRLRLLHRHTIHRPAIPHRTILQWQLPGHKHQSPDTTYGT